MQYLGGKSRIAKQISGVINEISRWQEQNCSTNSECNKQNGGGLLVSLFCGSCVVEAKINAKTKILNDNHKYLIEMFKGLQNGYELPEKITKEDYYNIKNNKDKDKVLTGFVGFGCSFGGKWFGGYAQNKTGTNYALQSKNSLLKTIKGLQNATFTNLDYKQVEIPDNAIVYCDPPYRNTTGYTTGKFDSNEFWQYMRELSKSHLVFISEENAPSDFECIWQKEVKRVLDVNKDNIKPKTEKLFVWKGEHNGKSK